MAVKVMLAPAIAKREMVPPAEKAAPEQKRKRRRSSVYDADGNEVFITLMCQKCHRMRPLSQFGLRRMADGAIRNQPWCRTCRSVSPEVPGKRRAASEPEAQLSAAASAPEKVIDSGVLAAQVVAALSGGRR